MNARPEQHRSAPFDRQAISAFPDAASDEISLIDLWLVLVRRRSAVFAILLACTVAGVSYALLAPKRFAYAVTVEIGSRLVGKVEDRTLEPVETPETVLARLRETYIPLVLGAYATKEGGDVPFRIDAKVPKGASVVVLEATGKETDGPAIRDVLKEIVGRLSDDHRRLQVTKFEDTQAVLNSRLNGLEQMEQTLHKEISDLTAYLQELSSQRLAVAAEAAQERAGPLGPVFVDVEMQRARERFAERQEQLIKTLDAQRILRVQIDETQGGAAPGRSPRNSPQSSVATGSAGIGQDQDVSRAVVERSDQGAGDVIGGVKNSAAGVLRETHAIAPPVRSLESIGPSRTMIVALAVLLGLMLGVFAAFFAEFLAKAKEQMGER